jgi:excisionase family DNA binding protein
MNQNLIGICEMAEKLDVPVSWIYSRTRTNEIPHLKIGKYVKFDPEKVMLWIQEQSETNLEGRCEQSDANHTI